MYRREQRKKVDYLCFSLEDNDCSFLFLYQRYNMSTIFKENLVSFTTIVIYIHTCACLFICFSLKFICIINEMISLVCALGKEEMRIVVVSVFFVENLVEWIWSMTNGSSNLPIGIQSDHHHRSQRWIGRADWSSLWMTNHSKLTETTVMFDRIYIDQVKNNSLLLLDFSKLTRKEKNSIVNNRRFFSLINTHIFHMVDRYSSH